MRVRPSAPAILRLPARSPLPSYPSGPVQEPRRRRGSPAERPPCCQRASESPAAAGPGRRPVGSGPTSGAAGPAMEPPFLYDHREAPGEDIWKKFELLASPPGSPPMPAAAEEPPDGLLGGNPGAFVLLRDCMWSGLAARERLERARGGDPTGAKTPALPGVGPQEPGLAGGECVAPGAVFAWPDGGGGGGTPADSKIPASSGSESPSDSEGEEIDVVTVEKKQSLGVRKPVTITVRADPLDPCMTHFHISIHQQQHNYAARSPAEEEEEEEEEVFSCQGPLEKSLPPQEEEEASDDGGRSPGPAGEAFSSNTFLLKSGSAPSSDSEDATKRKKNHNYLERKRRNDLRSRFLALRDQVPDLAACPKTPKVVVLSKASEYLQYLLRAEQQMVAEKKLLRMHQLQLQEQLSHLKGLP